MDSANWLSSGRFCPKATVQVKDHYVCNNMEEIFLVKLVENLNAFYVKLVVKLATRVDSGASEQKE